MPNKPKTIYDEAIADVKKLREVAEARARDAVLQRVEPQLKRLVERHLFEAEACDEGDVDEASGMGSGAVQGSMNVEEAGEINVGDPPFEQPRAAKDEEAQYEVAEVGSGLEQLADFARPVTDDRFAVEAYRIQEEVQSLVVAPRSEKATAAFHTRLDEAISKLEDMYAYLRETYAGTDRELIEGKLEKGYGLLNAVKETTMKMRDLLNEEDLTVKINNLPDGVDPDAITIDVVSDDADDAMAPEGAPATEPAAPPFPTAEADDKDDDEVLEISEAELTAELSRLGSLREADALPAVPKPGHPAQVVQDYGDGHSEGEPFEDSVSDLDQIDENESVASKADAEDERLKESVRLRLSRAAHRLSEARGTKRETFARAMYKGAVKAYRSHRALAEAPTKKNVTAALAKNAGGSKGLTEANGKVNALTKQLAASNLLNAKLIHANKLLRLEGLTKAQQAMVIDRLDEAQNLREVRLISDNIRSMLAGSKGSVNESATRRPSGSASRPSRSSAASAEPLNEGLETARWAQLAGLK